MPSGRGSRCSSQSRSTECQNGSGAIRAPKVPIAGGIEGRGAVLAQEGDLEAANPEENQVAANRAVELRRRAR